MTGDRVANALRLLEQIEEYAAFEIGLIDPSDYDRFSAAELLAVAEGRKTIEALAWGMGPEEPTDEDRLAGWRKRVQDWTPANT